MNEYQQRNEQRYSADAERVVELVAELNKIDTEKWTVIPRDNDLDHTPTRHQVRSESGLAIVCNHNGYGLDDRWRFSACGWPKYVDQDGSVRTISANDLWNPKEVSPSTEAADSRPYAAIAKQIVSKLVTPYRAIYARAVEKAQDWQQGADRQVAALQRVTEACGQTYEKGQQGNKTLYAMRDAKDSIRVEFRSEGDVILHLTTEQAITALEAIR